MMCVILLSVYVESQLTFDQHFKDHDRIVRVVNRITTNGQTSDYAFTSRSLGPLMTQTYPQVGEFVRIRNLAVSRTVFRYEDAARYWSNVRIADENIFDVFSHEPLYGELKGALSDPSSLVVSESFAKSYFGDRNPVGETVSTDTFTYQITAVFKDLPANTHLKYDALISMNRLRAFGLDDEVVSPEQLFDIELYSYFHLKPDIDIDTFNHLLRNLYSEYGSPIGDKINSNIEYVVQPLKDIHFDAGYRYDQPTGNVFYIYGLIAVAFFLLVVACINYTNLATARAIGRSKEIGMRRVLGASQQQLIAQFLGESVCVALVATLIGLVVIIAVNLAWGYEALLGSGVTINVLQSPWVLIATLLGSVAVGLASGLYPAFYLSSISPKAAIVNQRNMRKSGFSLREILVFIQFIVSIGIFSSTLIMKSQLEFIANKPMGFEKDNKLAVLIRGVDAIKLIPVMKTELENHPNIVSVSESSFVPGEEVAVTLMMVETDEGGMEEVTANQITTGRDFLKTVGVEVVDGRDFSKRFLTDVGASVLVNESFVKFMGWENPIGKRIQIADSRVIGVVKDFHFRSLHSRVGPMIIRQFNDEDLNQVPQIQRNLITRSLVVDMRGRDIAETLESIQKTVTSLDPQHPFEYSFFNDLLNEQYANDSKIMRLTGIFAVICILISCLGLFGLAALTTEQRTKEIGIRKVLGASTSHIIYMLTRGLLALVFTAAILAAVITYFIMDDWLRIFAYKTDIDMRIFVISTFVIGLLAFFTISLQAIRTTQQNPVNALRYE